MIEAIRLPWLLQHRQARRRLAEGDDGLRLLRRLPVDVGLRDPGDAGLVDAVSTGVGLADVDHRLVVVGHDEGHAVRALRRRRDDGGVVLLLVDEIRILHARAPVRREERAEVVEVLLRRCRRSWSSSRGQLCRSSISMRMPDAGLGHGLRRVAGRRRAQRARVGHRADDDRAVRVAVDVGEEHLRALVEREVLPVPGARVALRHADPLRRLGSRPAREVEGQADPVAALAVDHRVVARGVGVDVRVHDPLDAGPGGRALGPVGDVEGDGVEAGRVALRRPAEIPLERAVPPVGGRDRNADPVLERGDQVLHVVRGLEVVLELEGVADPEARAVGAPDEGAALAEEALGPQLRDRLARVLVLEVLAVEAHRSRSPAACPPSRSRTARRPASGSCSPARRPARDPALAQVERPDRWRGRPSRGCSRSR